jgi:hypothetical protein
MDWMLNGIGLTLLVSQLFHFVSDVLYAKFNPKRNWSAFITIMIQGVILAYSAIYLFSFINLIPFVLIILAGLFWLFRLTFSIGTNNYRGSLSSRLSIEEKTWLRTKWVFFAGDLLFVFLTISIFILLVITTLPIMG